MTKRKTSKPVTTQEKQPLQGINRILEKRIRLKCRGTSENNKQKQYANLITEKEIVICVGPAGCGKTYVAVSRAIELLQNKTNKYNKLILCKPSVEAGEKLGFLPGDLREKMAPIMDSLIDVIDKIVGKEKRIELENSEFIKLQTLAFIRGKTIDNAILIVDEAQNMTKSQMKSILTRIGSNSKFIISGDLDQSDLFKDYKLSGLNDACNRHKNVKEIGFIKFENKDIVRNPIITKILDNYKPKKEKNDYKKINTNNIPTNTKIPIDNNEIVKNIKATNKRNLFIKKILKKFKW